MTFTPVIHASTEAENAAGTVRLASAPSSDARQQMHLVNQKSQSRVTDVLPAQANRFLLILSDWQGHMIQPGGIASYIDTLTRGLVSLGDSVKILAVVRPDESLPTAFLKACGPSAIPFQLGRDKRPENWLGRKVVSALDIARCLSPFWRHVVTQLSFFSESRAAIAKLENLLIKENPTAIIFGNCDERIYPVALCLLQCRRPYGIIAHGCEIAKPATRGFSDLAQRKTLLKRASWIAANSRHTQSLLLEMWRIAPEKIKIIHPPISAEAIRQSADRRRAPRRDDALRLVTICRLVKGKGIDIVVRALKILSERGIPCRYEIGGDGPERSFLESLVDELGLRGRVKFSGSVEGQDKWNLLRSSDVYVMPSRFMPSVRFPWQESFGIAFAEAAVFGLPAIGSKSGGIPDAVVDGETGILIPEESPEDLAEALMLFFRNPDIRQKMGRAADERARRLFSPEVIASRFREEVASIRAARRSS